MKSLTKPVLLLSLLGIMCAHAQAADDNSVPDMVEIPSGVLERFPDKATFPVEAFYLSTTEITNKQWNAVSEWAASNGYDLGPREGDDNLPVIRVSWYNAVKWCNALSELAGRQPVYYRSSSLEDIYRNGELNIQKENLNQAANGFRLPTAKEWEYALYSGKKYPFAEPDSKKNEFIYDYAWLDKNTGGKLRNNPQPVGTRKPNEFGLHDMFGNVWEWCYDKDGDFIGYSDDPLGFDEGKYRVLCGGSAETRIQRAALVHLSYIPSHYSPYVGFRVASSTSADALSLDNSLFNGARKPKERVSLPEQKQIGKSPNLLILYTDEHNFRTIGAYRDQLPEYAGNPWGSINTETPNLDRIAKEGAIATHFYTPSPVCSPSRACFMTGMYPNKTGVQTNSKHVNEGGMTFAETLRLNGYHTIYLGKWHLSGDYDDWGDDLPNNYGWTDNRLLWNTGHQKKIEDIPGEKHPKKHSRGAVGDENSYTTDYLANKALEKIEAVKDKPFACMVSIPDPHGPDYTRSPYNAMYPKSDIHLPKSFFAEYPAWAESGKIESEEQFQEIMSQYFGMVKLIDDNVGKIINRLEELGVLDNTIIVYTADHGDMCGEHQRLDKGVPYEAAAKIPLLIRYPKKIDAGTVVKQNLSVIDFLPTILSMMDVESAGEQQGRNASAIFTGNTPPENWDNSVIVLNGSESYLAIVDGNYKLIVSNFDHPYLFNLEKDPLEDKNIIDEVGNEKLVTSMARKLKDYCLRYKDPSYLMYQKQREDIEALIKKGKI